MATSLGQSSSPWYIPEPKGIRIQVGATTLVKSVSCEVIGWERFLGCQGPQAERKETTSQKWSLKKIGWQMERKA